MPKIFINPENSKEEVFQKSKNEVIEYIFKWKQFLGSVTISSSTMTTSSGLTLDSSSNGTDETGAVVSGGSGDAMYSLTNQIVTSDSRTYEHRIWVKIKPEEETKGYGF